MKSSTLLATEAIINGADFMASQAIKLANDLYHEGRLEDARCLLLSEVESATGNAQMWAVVCLAKVEWAARNYPEAVRLLEGIRADAEGSKDHQLLWRFHHILGGCLQLTGRDDPALIEYAASSYHQEQAGEREQAGISANNVALIQTGLGRFRDAREQIARARSLLRGREVTLAEVDETEAQVCLAEDKARPALALALKAATTFERCGEERLLMACLPTLIKAAADCATLDYAEARERVTR